MIKSMNAFSVYFWFFFLLLHNRKVMDLATQIRLLTDWKMKLSKTNYFSYYILRLKMLYSKVHLSTQLFQNVFFLKIFCVANWAETVLKSYPKAKIWTIKVFNSILLKCRLKLCRSISPNLMDQNQKYFG